MRPTFRVRFWAIQNKKGRRRPYGVRWITDAQEHSEWFTLRVQADARRSELMQAARRGAAFDITTGLPESEYRERNAKTLLELGQRFIDHEWSDAAANTRRRGASTRRVMTTSRSVGVV